QPGAQRQTQDRDHEGGHEIGGKAARLRVGHGEGSLRVRWLDPRLVTHGARSAQDANPRVFANDGRVCGGLPGIAAASERAECDPRVGDGARSSTLPPLIGLETALTGETVAMALPAGAVLEPGR